MYIHDLNPVLLPIWGPLAIRWYGLAYVGGFVGAYFILNRWGKRGNYPLSGEALQNFMIAIVVGVMLGGRIGFTFFYDFPQFLRDPVSIFRLWEGGMSSHGGMIGMTLATLYMSLKLKAPLLQLTDGLAAVAPLGLGLGRLANFVNGELWGRVTNVPWAVVFPQEAGIQRGDPDAPALIEAYLAQGYLHPRHPSQLYQAALEGVFLLTVLLLARRTRWAAAVPGRISGLFLILYAIVRVIAERFREPEIVHLGWLTQGQLLSLLILLPVGVVLVKRAK
jgi:phosphatidylglycerol:prolipoprotein diacylglycerol transferase